MSWYTIQRHGYRIRLYPTSLSAAIWYDRNDFTSIEQLIRRILREGDHVIDVGANIGTTALCAGAVVGELGGVMAIEPHPRTYRFLQGNVRLNKMANVQTINCALGARDGYIGLSDTRSDDMNAVDDAGIQVRLSSLDSLSDGMREVALLKIDVEGYEKYVIEGAVRTLERVQCVLFEASTEAAARHQSSVLDVIMALKERGFETFELRNDGELSRSSGAPTAESQAGDNLLATRDVASLQTRLNTSPRNQV
jgi:FkbM family methyltransferase